MNEDQTVIISSKQYSFKSSEEFQLDVTCITECFLREPRQSCFSQQLFSKNKFIPVAEERKKSEVSAHLSVDHGRC